jgi:hypothetical protein
MTVLELFTLGMGQLAEPVGDNPVIRDRFMVGWTNIVLHEAFDAENSIRRSLEETELTSAQTVTSGADVLTYHDQLLYTALPYGIAVQAYVDDDNDYRANKYRQMFIAGLQDCSKITFGTVEDVYSDSTSD